MCAAVLMESVFAIGVSMTALVIRFAVDFHLMESWKILHWK